MHALRLYMYVLISSCPSLLPQSLPRSKQADTVIALYGQYSYVTLLDSNSLEVLCTLRSSHAPNWTASIAFLSNIEKKGH